ncbi:hypothetical protein LCGC14_0800390 [marine sediment metagenome]|uniref:Uncharacterized protein n=1 Tax=marine sediment metagenome TaxID=412755 RepID=A0A0F9PPW8_9ZZZZ
MAGAVGALTGREKRIRQMAARMPGGVIPRDGIPPQELAEAPAATPEPGTVEQRTEQRGGVDVGDIMQAVAEQAQSGELAAKAKPPTQPFSVNISKADTPELVADQPGDRVDFFVSGTVSGVDEQGNVTINGDTISVVHGRMDKPGQEEVGSERFQKLSLRDRMGARRAA